MTVPRSPSVPQPFPGNSRRPELPTVPPFPSLYGERDGERLRACRKHQIQGPSVPLRERGQQCPERWRPIPGHEGYDISDRGNVRSVDRVTIRRNGSPYTVRGRIRRISVGHRDGLRYVKLATGRRGRYRTVYIHRLVAEVFGKQEAA